MSVVYVNIGAPCPNCKNPNYIYEITAPARLNQHSKSLITNKSGADKVHHCDNCHRSFQASRVHEGG
jgi:hypothetical protein